MLTHIYLCIMVMTMIYLNTINAIPVSSIDSETQENKLSDALMLEQLGIGSHHYLTDHQYDDNISEDESLHQKRQLKRKWSAFHHGAHSPYTIAFPALIRTRRWIEQEQ